MCGIVAIYASMLKESQLRQAALDAGKRYVSFCTKKHKFFESILNEWTIFN